jgi:hypothetical protein
MAEEKMAVICGDITTGKKVKEFKMGV